MQVIPIPEDLQLENHHLMETATLNREVVLGLCACYAALHPGLSRNMAILPPT